MHENGIVDILDLWAGRKLFQLSPILDAFESFILMVLYHRIQATHHLVALADDPGLFFRIADFTWVSQMFCFMDRTSYIGFE